MKYCYIVTEGQHDIEFLGQLIKPFGFSKIQKRSLVDSFWDKLIPDKFPVDDDLFKRVPVPLFWQNNDYSIALHSATGIKLIAKTLEESIAVIDSSNLFSIGLILDADDQEKPIERFNKLMTDLEIKLDLINLKSVKLGEVSTHQNLRFGVFIIPNNQDSGTLEEILIECAKLNYPNLFQLAKKYIENIDRNKLNKNDLKEINKPAGENKAIISSISSVLKPGKSIQVSLQDNRWIDENTLKLQNIIILRDFITNLLGLNE